MNAVGIWIRRAENLISYSALAILLLSVLWGVLTRYITERPAVWTTELSGILFTWVVYIGALTAFRNSHHIRVTLLVDIFPAFLRRFLFRLGDLVVLMFLVYVTYLSVIMMIKGASRPSPVMDIPFSWVYLATVISFSGMTVVALLQFVGILKQTESNESEAL